MKSTLRRSLWRGGGGGGLVFSSPFVSRGVAADDVLLLVMLEFADHCYWASFVWSEGYTGRVIILGLRRLEIVTFA